jgi:hypothetical protein
VHHRLATTAASVATAVVLVVAAGGCADDVVTRAAPWTLARESGRTLFLDVTVGSSSCSTVRRAVVDEHDDGVHIVVRVRDDVGGGDDCTSDESHETIRVVLLAERDGRALTGCDPDQPGRVCEAQPS